MSDDRAKAPEKCDIRKEPHKVGSEENVQLNNTRLSQDKPHSARMYDYFLGGKTNYVVDRQAAEEVLRHRPGVVVAARANRAFTNRAVKYLALAGIRQFIDIGTGIPTAPNMHEIAQSIAADSTVVYVDNDPIVLVYAEELLDSAPEGATRYVEADATNAHAVLAAVRETGCVDFTRPVAVNLHALLHFMPDSHGPYDVVRTLIDHLAPGSYLSVSHVTGEFAPAAWQAIADIYTNAGTPVQIRSREQIARFFDGLQLVEPGLVVAHRWKPEPASGPSLVTDADVSLYAGIGRKV
ncbi:SAM-dependent methyltransferase [Streptomyces zagrosensis]|uniref:Methyltransferase n=1 Tax=Streptomyces zagrosensis TaxID=1042984 RepID=A0A7W9UYX1_9ACTN|nr:SAM-dependent methyltransferase [Streptomyces zagrosensis]MBB5936405.1 hypothetical protein [Streptomyces zagrosensis]